MQTDRETERAALLALAEHVERAFGLDNATDVLVEVALFRPDADWTAARANAAGTKVIYTAADGSESTRWAPGWTMKRFAAAAALRALASQEPRHDQ